MLALVGTEPTATNSLAVWAILLKRQNRRNAAQFPLNPSRPVRFCVGVAHAAHVEVVQYRAPDLGLLIIAVCEVVSLPSTSAEWMNSCQSPPALWTAQTRSMFIHRTV